ncbi:COesterase domain-containing protein [Mycena venus]|uniref:COesterase domain-containing protein n=1 Tax=Mycena venus TaxID=2733690 RepID=A0A8H7CVT4_9AGAR|nr:COesterase domain-containing protein [Mycena venus]
MGPLLTIGLIVALVLQAQVVIGATPTPTIILDNGAFTGVATTPDTQSFLGIPSAQPPCALFFSFHSHIRLINYRRVAMGPACPQQTAVVPILTGLTLNIIKPANATADSKLPVVLWLFAGGFEFGTPARYNGVPIVQRSIAMDQPIIYVSINYRVSAFGFLGGKQVRKAGVGNLGLHDQREALRWVQNWGESAGAISVSLQMLANGGDTEGLFRAGYMQSGSPVPVGPFENGQKYYDDLVAQTGCSGAADTLACLRTVPYGKLKAAQDASPFFLSYQSLVLAWLPREDGIFLTDQPQRLVQQGKVANVPFIVGNCDDEGTLFSLSTLNITVWAPSAGQDTVAALATAYPSELAQGSPFGTGILQALTPQFKRLAAFQGDAVFHAPRRFFQQARSGKQDQWAYLNKRYKSVPFLGSFHTTDVFNVYQQGELTDYLINFVTTLDPNGPTVPSWPKYTTESPNLMTFEDGLLQVGATKGKTEVTQDTFRVEAMKVLTDVSLEFPI